MSNPLPKPGPRQRLSGWLREHLSVAPRVSRTKVQVLSSTNGVPWFDPSSHESHRSLWQRIRGVKGKTKVQDTEIVHTELKGAQVAQEANDTHPPASEKSSSASWSFLPRRFRGRSKRRTAKVAQMPTTKCKSSLGSDDRTPTSTSRQREDLLLLDFEDNVPSCLDENKLHSGQTATKNGQQVLLKEKPVTELPSRGGAAGDEVGATSHTIGIRVKTEACSAERHQQSPVAVGKLARPNGVPLRGRRRDGTESCRGRGRTTPGFLLHEAQTSHRVRPTARSARMQKLGERNAAGQGLRSDASKPRNVGIQNGEETQLFKSTELDNNSSPTCQESQANIKSESEVANNSPEMKPHRFAEYPIRSDGPSLSARPTTRRGRGMSGHVDVSCESDQFDAPRNSIYNEHAITPSGGRENYFRNAAYHQYKGEAFVDVWRNDEAQNDLDEFEMLERQCRERCDYTEDHDGSVIAEEEQELANDQFKEVQRNSTTPTISGDDQVSAEDLKKLQAKQNEQWELAALGEWSLICHDDGEGEDNTDCYLRKDEFQKAQTIRENLSEIISYFQDVHVIQDFQKMLCQPGSPKDQIERALRQYARICRGPVPLSVSGQTKAEAVASISVLLCRQTKRFVKEPPCDFSTFHQVFLELEVLRNRQDRVEVSLSREVKREERKKKRSRRRRRRGVNLKLPQWELDKNLVDIYRRSKIKSIALIEVMATIVEQPEEGQKKDL